MSSGPGRLQVSVLSLLESAREPWVTLAYIEKTILGAEASETDRRKLRRSLAALEREGRVRRWWWETTKRCPHCGENTAYDRVRLVGIA
jgi:hypothetical protein